MAAATPSSQIYLPLAIVPPALQFMNSRVFTSSLSYDLIVKGEVVNTSSQTVYSPDILVTFYRPDGSQGGHGNGNPMLRAIGPGEVSPFRILHVSEPTLDWNRYELTSSIFPYNQAITCTHALPLIEVTTTSYYQQGLSIKGKLVNNSDNGWSSAQVFGTAYDNEGHVLDVNPGISFNLSLPQGGQLPFSVSLYMGSVSAVFGYRLTAEACQPY